MSEGRGGKQWNESRLKEWNEGKTQIEREGEGKVESEKEEGWKGRGSKGFSVWRINITCCQGKEKNEVEKKT